MAKLTPKLAKRRKERLAKSFGFREPETSAASYFELSKALEEARRERIRKAQEVERANEVKECSFSPMVNKGWRPRRGARATEAPKFVKMNVMTF